MIIIPEMETIVITPPRTASTSILRVIKESYPEAISLYRHMEASGIPTGYNLWRKVGLVRQPLERLWSVYKYTYKNSCHHKQQIKELSGETNIPEFDEWVLHNTIPMVTGIDYYENIIPTYLPYYSCLYTMPENRKSQFMYLRPDLGTEVFRFDRINMLEQVLDVFFPKINGTEDNEVPEVSKEVERHVKKYFSWDLQQFN
jgi:hypothetical protein